KGLGPRRQERHRVEPHPARDRIDDGEYPADQSGPDPGRRQRASDSRFDRRSSAYRPYQSRAAARARAALPGLRRCAQPEVRGRGGGRANGPARRVLHPPHRAGGGGRARHDSRSDVARRQPAGRLPVSGEIMTAPANVTKPTLLASTMRIFDLSLGQMLWSRRSMLLAFLVGAPVLLAAALRIASSADRLGLPRIHGARVGGAALFGMMMWL